MTTNDSSIADALEKNWASLNGELFLKFYWFFYYLYLPTCIGK